MRVAAEVEVDLEAEQEGERPDVERAERRDGLLEARVDQPAQMLSASTTLRNRPDEDAAEADREIARLGTAAACESWGIFSTARRIGPATSCGKKVTKQP